MEAEIITTTETQGSGVEVIGPAVPGSATVLTPAALAFVAELARKFGPRVRTLLERRKARQARLLAGETYDFLPETAEVRKGEWTVAPLPRDLHDRRVEITGPVDRKMIINALNSGAQVFMADFEDSNAPTWANCVAGQVNLRDAVAGTIEYVDPIKGKEYRLRPERAVLMVRPRGLHLVEQHLHVDGKPAPASLVDFGMFFFHNAKALIANGSGPYFYLPKLESHLEARLWNDVFEHAQRALSIDSGTIKATVLIETLPAAFEMDEILYELRTHSAGLNCGRWDYIFSYIKKHQHDAECILPDRDQVGMTQPFMRAYTQLVIRTCHRRGVHAMGGMAAQIPIKQNPEANEAALAKVRADKLREVLDGHDGTWVAHPGLIPIAREVFDAHMPGANQIDKKREDVFVRAEDLLRVPTGTRTEEGLRKNVRVGIQYLEAWLGGLGCVPLYHLMEDAATAEISRTQVWQWLRHGATLDDDKPLTNVRFRQIVDSELKRIREELGRRRFSRGRFRAARELFEQLCTSSELVEFLTLPAYDRLVSDDSDAPAPPAGN